MYTVSDKFILYCKRHKRTFKAATITYVDDNEQTKTITRDNIEFLRPAPENSFEPYRVDEIINKKVNKFKNKGITSDIYLNYCIKNPALFRLEYNESDKNDNEFTAEDYINACLRNPIYFQKDPESIRRNINGVIEIYKDKGITAAQYLSACSKNINLLTLTPETMEEHINAMVFSDLNSPNPKGETDCIKHAIENGYGNLTYSTDLILLKTLVIPKVFKDSDIPGDMTRYKSDLKNKFKLYLKKHPDDNYELDVKGSEKDIEMLKKCLAEFSDRPDRFTVKVIK